MKKKKLMVVTPYFYPDSGGVANHTYNLYKRLAKKEFEITVITSGEKFKEEKIENMKIYRLPRQFKISNTPISFKWKSQIRKIIEKEKPNIICGHMPVPFISDVAAFVSGKIPFIIKYHHGGSMKKGKFFQDILIGIYESIFLKKLLKKSRIIITASEFVTKEFMKDYAEKTITITPGVDTKKFKPDIKINSKNKILFVANLKKSERYKGLDYLLEAVLKAKKQIKDIKLIIVGDGDCRKYYENLVRKLDLEKNIYFRGKLTHKEIVKEYQNTNIFILPSLFDATPNVLLEAMACEKPVIGTNIGGIPYLIKNNENGILVPAENSKALAKAIVKILKNSRLAKKMGEFGYAKVKENFTWDAQVCKTQNLMMEILKNEYHTSNA